MNILILANHFNAGGISSYILNLAQGLVLKGHNVYVGTSPGCWLDRLLKTKARHITLPLNTKSIISLKLFYAYSILKKFIKDNQIDVIHAQTRTTSFLADRLSKKTKIPYLTIAHGFFKPRLARRLFPSWGKLVIAISEQVKQHLMQDFNIDENKIRLIHNGIDAKKYELKTGIKEGLNRKFNLSGNDFVVGIIARLSEVKGHKYLIMAMKEVIKEIPQAELLIVGDGSLKKDLENLTDMLGIHEKIHFIASVDDTREVLSNIDVFVMPSLQEGLGLSVMEALAQGIPVVASNVGGIPSLIKDNQTGILVKACDVKELSRAIICLLRDKEKAKLLASQGRELVIREFSLAKMVDDTEGVYKECVG